MGLFSRIFGGGYRPPTRPSADADHRADGWPFDQAPETAAVTTRQVMEEGHVVQVVIHYGDDHSWAFLCGTTDVQDDGRVMTMRTLLEMDDSLRSIADLPPGWRAWREKRGDAWFKEPDPAFAPPAREESGTA